MTETETGAATASRVTGGCACGAVRYSMGAKPIVVYACHCTDCQRLTGSAFILSAWIEKTEVELLSGAPSSCRLPTGQRGSAVHFCAQCGTYVWSEYSPGFCFVRVTTLDDQTAYPPQMHIWTQSKLPWLQLSEDVPHYETSYDREKAWPADSLARYHAVRTATEGGPGGN